MADDSVEGAYSREVLIKILKRATEIELRRDLITDAELREIAAEVGIDASALHQAVEEISRSRSTSNDSRNPGRIRSRTLTAGFFGSATALGVVIGAATGIARTMTESHGVHVETLVGTALAGLATISLALAVKGSSRHVRFHAGNLGLWLGVSGGFGLAVPHLADDMFGVGLCAAAALGLAGSILIELLHRRRQRRADQPVSRARMPAAPDHMDQNDDRPNNVFSAAAVGHALTRLAERGNLAPCPAQ